MTRELARRFVSRRCVSWTVVCVLGAYGWIYGAATTRAQAQGADEQWGLANQLFQEGEFYRAITEYKRFLYYFPEEARAQTARLRIVEAYVRGRWWRKGLVAAEDLLAREDPEIQRGRVLLLRGICQMRLGRLQKARSSFEEVLEVSRDPELRGRAQYLLAETFARAADWQDAADALKGVEPQSSVYDRALRAREKIRLGTPLEEKSPWLAGFLAVLLPGAGHLYSERYLDAGLVFSVNAAFVAGTVEAIQRDNAALAGGLAMAELLWYSGNIFSAVGSAHKYNRNLRENLLKEIGTASAGEARLPFLAPR